MCNLRRKLTRLERAVSEHIHTEVSAQVNREFDLGIEEGYGWDFAEAMVGSWGLIDIFEWWTVSEDFCNQALLRGEVIVETPFGYVWGRQTTGQRLTQDLNVQLILENILQSYSE